MWFIFALSGAFFKALTGFFRKKIASTKIPQEIYLWTNSLIFSLVLLPAILYFDYDVIEVFRSQAWLLIGAAVTSNLAIAFTIQALKREELSYIAPLNAFIPIYALILAWIFIGEAPPSTGVVGVTLVFIGVYVMNLKSPQIKWYDPILHLSKNTGARFGMGVAVSFAVTAIMFKGLTNGGVNAIEGVFAVNVINVLILSPVPIIHVRKLVSTIHPNRRLLLIVSLCSLAGILLNYLALERTFSSYAVSVRRLDVVFSVLLGWKVLKETDIRVKIVGSTLMALGVIVMTLL